MNRLTARNTRSLPALAAALALLPVAAASAGEAPQDAQAQAQALLTANASARADNAAVLSPAGAADATEPAIRARWLLTGEPATRLHSPALVVDSVGAARNGHQRESAGAGDSARSMILGTGTR